MRARTSIFDKIAKQKDAAAKNKFTSKKNPDDEMQFSGGQMSSKSRFAEDKLREAVKKAVVESFTEKKNLKEELPPHLAKFFDDAGNLTPDAAERIRKYREENPNPKSIKDVTPKGYGPKNEGEGKFQVGDEVRITSGGAAGGEGKVVNTSEGEFGTLAFIVKLEKDADDSSNGRAGEEVAVQPEHLDDRFYKGDFGMELYDIDENQEKEMMAKMSNKELYKYLTHDKFVAPNLKGDMGPIPGLEGPFQYRSGAVLYYDPREGKYYDRRRDMYLDNDEALALVMEDRTTMSSDPEMDQIEDIALTVIEKFGGLMSIGAALKAQGFDASVSNGALSIDGKYFMGKADNFDISPDEDVRKVGDYVLGFMG